MWTFGRCSVLFHIERSQLRWFRRLIRMCPGRLPLEVFWACPTGRRPPGQTLNTLEGLQIPSSLGTPRNPNRRSWRLWLGRGLFGLPCLACCHCGLVPRQRKKMDGWMFAFMFANIMWDQEGQRDLDLLRICLHPPTKNKERGKQLCTF